ncbi:hypothetical protein BGX20_007176, partial [Mortierella sp. AD010]
MILDFPGWTEEEQVSSYLERLGQGLSDDEKERLALLFPKEVIHVLFRDYRGRFRPIVSVIEDIIETDDPLKWRHCIKEREYRLTTADSPETPDMKELLEGNLCQELSRILAQVERDPVTYAQYQNVKSTLKFAMAAFKTQGGFFAYKRKLPELVEASFGRIRRYQGEFRTVVDEPFAFR